MGHSPLPWKWTEYHGDLLDSSGETVLAIGQGYDGLWGGDYPSESDAEYIERACNSYPALVSALKAARASIVEMAKGTELRHNEAWDLTHPFTEIDAALKLADGDPA